jgi:hypothetical protein
MDSAQLSGARYQTDTSSTAFLPFKAAVALASIRLQRVLSLRSQNFAPQRPVPLALPEMVGTLIPQLLGPDSS